MDSNRTIEVKLTVGAKYFTIPQIIEEAARIFGFEVTTQSDGGKLYDKIKHQVGRKLKGKKTYGEGTRNRKYSRNDVQHLLQADLYNYFMKISRERNESRYNTLKSKSEQLASARQKVLEKLTESATARGTMVPEYREQTKGWMAEEVAYLIRERDGEQTEDDIELSMRTAAEKKRKEIFFEFLYQSLFDSLIEFDEARFREDFAHQLEGYCLPDEPIQAEATLRLMDNRNYYQIKELPEEIKILLAKLTAATDEQLQ